MVRNLAVLTLATFSASSAAAAPRVVVQDVPDAYPAHRRFSPDGSHVALLAGTWRHLLVVIDLNAKQVIYQRHMPDVIESFDFDADNRSLGFCGQHGLYWLDLKSGAVETLASGSFAAVAVQSGGALVAALGQIDDDDDAPSAFGRMLSLGVFDRKERAWKWKRSTPIVVAGALESCIAFDGDEAVVRGTGGNPYSMLPVIFPVDMRLNVKTGACVVATGPSTGRFGSKLPKGAAAKPIVKVEAGVKWVHLEKYEPPKALKAAEGKTAKMLAEAKTQAVFKELTVSQRTSHHYTPIMSQVTKDDLRLALQAPSGKGFGSNLAVLTIRRDGSTSLGPTRPDKEGRLGLRHLFYKRVFEPLTIRDLDGKEVLFESDIGDRKRRNLYFFDDGTAVLVDGNALFHRLGEKKPVWHWSDTGTCHTLVTDAGAEHFAISGDLGNGRVVVLRKKDGALVGKAPSMGNPFLGMSHALSADAREIALVHENELLVFEAATAKEIERVSLKGKATYPRVFAFSGDWLISGYDHARTYHVKAGFGKPFPIREVMHVQEVHGAKRKRLVLQDGRGRCLLIDPDKGDILADWMAGDGGSSESPPYNTPLPGGVLLRSLGIRGEVDLLDADDGRVVAHVHVMPVDSGVLGYVIYTEDGLWDATAGAEKYVLLFNDGRALTNRERDARRDGAAIRRRIGAAFE
ncbi:MAG: hypothetical protein U0793_01605 [Gemmataceae bacterium]